MKDDINIYIWNILFLNTSKNIYRSRVTTRIDYNSDPLGYGYVLRFGRNMCAHVWLSSGKPIDMNAFMDFCSVLLVFACKIVNMLLLLSWFVCHGLVDIEIWVTYQRIWYEFLSMRLCSMNLKLYKLARIITKHSLSNDDDQLATIHVLMISVIGTEIFTYKAKKNNNI